ncbi:hypothetical protein [Mucisphaera calidilacus]|uniref:hypothetical protein n=1 Tax=Mucisphaera calidilacus TaxID=2527982 RepID=UPI003703B64B
MGRDEFVVAEVVDTHLELTLGGDDQQRVAVGVLLVSFFGVGDTRQAEGQRAHKTLGHHLHLKNSWVE